MATLTGSSKGSRYATFIDMTPMVDLAFLLLTFFVLTTSLSQPWALPIAMPEKVTDTTKQPPIDAKRVLTLVLGKRNEIYWYMGIADGHAEKTNFSSSGVRKVLERKQSEIKNMVVLIKPSAQSQYKNVVDILDEMLITEIKRYAVVDMETEDKNILSRNQQE